MDDKKLSEEIKSSLINNSCHSNFICDLLKQNFLNNCKYNKDSNITLNLISKNVFCIKLYNEYYDCYKNDKVSKNK